MTSADSGRDGLAIRRAVVVGFQSPAFYLARVMNEHSGHWQLDVFRNTRLGIIRALLALRGADALICFGGPGPDAALALAARRRRIPIVVIWAGTDVLLASRDPVPLEATKRDTSADLTVSPWLAEELRAIGLQADYAPIVGSVVDDTLEAPFPPRFTVLTYLPMPRRAFYGEDQVYAIARAMKEVRFIVVGSGGRSPKAPPNVDFLGWVADTTSVVDSATVLLRIPEHDGQSMMVLDAMARGRYVIWTHKLPGVHVAANANDAFEALRELYQRHQSGRLDFNVEGRDYVAKECRLPDIARKLEFRLDRLVPTRSANGRHKRVAITGYDLFCADVATNIERLHPEWEAELLRPRSRLQVLASLFDLARADVWYSIGSPSAPRWMHYFARLCGVPRIMHWVGSDIEAARVDDSLRRTAKTARATHLAEIGWTAQELAAIGLDSEIRPLPARHCSNGVKALPEQFTILLYIPKSRADFYGRSEYERLLSDIAEAKPRVFIVGGGRLSVPVGVEAIDCGWRSDLKEVYEQSTVLIRCTPHDGLALMVLEALSFGRYVIWSQPLPGVTRVSNYDQLLAAVRRLLARHLRGELRAQYARAELVQRRYGAERCISDIVSVFEQVSAK